LIQDRTHFVSPIELAAALLTARLSSTLLATLLTTLLSALLALSAASVLTATFLITLTARSLLTTLLTATLIFFAIVCHDFFLLCSVLLKLTLFSVRKTDNHFVTAAFIQNRLQRLS
jgi:hypothetical protein